MVNIGQRVSSNLPGSKSEVRKKSELFKINPKYYRFLIGAHQSINGLLFTQTGWANIARRFGLTVEQAQAYASEFISEGGGHEAS